MNNKGKSEKFRKLSIAALVTGILGFGNAFLFMAFVSPFVGSYLGNFIFIPGEIYIIFLVSFLVICLPVPAIVCGSIDLKRIKAGRYSNKGKGLDIAGIVLGSVFILLVAVVFLPRGPVTNYEPAWSPDGTKITFTSEQGYIATIWAMDADGSNQTKLTYGYTHSSAWSPDSTKIFFIGSGGAYAGIGDYAGIYVIDSDGSNQKRLLDIADDYKYLAWSPDGIKIAFASLSSGNADIWVMEADGSNQINLTNSASDDYFPSWSPDGTKIAFESEQQGNADIWVMEADGSNQINLTNSATGDYDPAWSPDGTKIAFVSEPESRSFIEWWSATEEGTKVRVFGSEQQGNTDIWVMNADGSNQIRLTETEGWDGQPAWSPDDTKIVFTSHRDGDVQIYVMNADGSNQIRLTK